MKVAILSILTLLWINVVAVNMPLAIALLIGFGALGHILWFVGFRTEKKKLKV
mgnify:CR=1 FL=1